MRKKPLFLILFVSLLLGACANQATTPDTEFFGTQSVAPTASPVQQKATQPAVPSQTAEVTTAPGLAVNGCTVQSPYPTPGPTEQALLPPPGENDWVIGLETASTTLTEYSDFQ